MKFSILRIRPEFKRVIFIQIIKKHMEPDLKKAKKIADTILSKKKCENNYIDLNTIEEIGNLGLDLHFSYWDEDDFFEGIFDSSNGLKKWKVQTKFSNSEIENCLKDLKNPVLVGTHKKNYSIIEASEPPMALVIENNFLADQCVEHLLSKNVKIYKSINDLG